MGRVVDQGTHDDPECPHLFSSDRDGRINHRVEAGTGRASGSQTYIDCRCGTAASPPLAGSSTPKASASISSTSRSSLVISDRRLPLVNATPDRVSGCVLSARPWITCIHPGIDSSL